MKKVIHHIGGHLRRRIRCIIWKQWKTCNNRYKNLVKLGITEGAAKGLSYTRKSYWHVSRTNTIELALSNKRLSDKGLLSPEEHYNKVHI